MRITTYHRVVTKGDVAVDEEVPFSLGSHAPVSREEALECVNRWNRLVAGDMIRAGSTWTRIFYYIGEDV